MMSEDVILSFSENINFVDLMLTFDLEIDYSEHKDWRWDTIKRGRHREGATWGLYPVEEEKEKVLDEEEIEDKPQSKLF